MQPAIATLPAYLVDTPFLDASFCSWGLWPDQLGCPRAEPNPLPSTLSPAHVSLLPNFLPAPHLQKLWPFSVPGPINRLQALILCLSFHLSVSLLLLVTGQWKVLAGGLRWSQPTLVLALPPSCAISVLHPAYCRCVCPGAGLSVFLPTCCVCVCVPVCPLHTHTLPLLPLCVQVTIPCGGQEAVWRAPASLLYSGEVLGLKKSCSPKNSVFQGENPDSSPAAVRHVFLRADALQADHGEGSAHQT